MSNFLTNERKNELQIFSNEEFGEVRTVVINNEPWFVGKDVAKSLGYKDTSDALKRHIDDEDKLTRCFTDSGQNREMYVINESGLYSLVLSSKLESAKKFKRWVTSEVLPIIRKTGGYVANDDLFIETYLPDANDETKILFRGTLETVRKLNREKQELTKKIEEDRPFTDFAKRITISKDAIDMGEFAKVINGEDIHIGRNRLFEWLRKNGYLMSSNAPYQKYVDNGYFTVTEVTKSTPYGEKVFTKTLITGNGQVAITEKLRKEFTEFCA